jgi:hypothetical protein
MPWLNEAMASRARAGLMPRGRDCDLSRLGYRCPSQSRARFFELALELLYEPGNPRAVILMVRRLIVQTKSVIKSKSELKADGVSCPRTTKLYERRGIAENLPRALAAARATLVRWEITARSFSASAANRCSMKGSASASSSATRKGTRCVLSRKCKWTSRDRRSSFETATGHVLSAQRGVSQRGGELRPAIEGVRSLARLDLGELGDYLEALGLSEPSYSVALCVQAEPRTSLLASADPVVGDDRLDMVNSLFMACRRR